MPSNYELDSNETRDVHATHEFHIYACSMIDDSTPCRLYNTNNDKPQYSNTMERRCKRDLGAKVAAHILAPVASIVGRQFAKYT